MDNYSKYRRIVEWAAARYQPRRGDTSLATRTYNAIVVAAQHRYFTAA